MAVADAWPLQQAVYSALRSALDGEGETAVEIYDHVPTNTEPEHVRLEGFDIADASFKDTERGRHSVMIHFFSGTATRGQKRVHAILGVLHDAVKDLRHGRGRMHFEFMDVDSGDDHAREHGFLRYTIVV